MNGDLNLTSAELAMLLGEPAASTAAGHDGAAGAASAAEPVEQTVRALGATVRALAARVEQLEALVKELRLEALERHQAEPPARSMAAEETVRPGDAVQPAAAADGGEPRLSRVARLGRRRG